MKMYFAVEYFMKLTGNVQIYSYSAENHAYYLVKFVKTGELEVIPCTWRYSDTECYFPTHLKNEEERLEKVKNCVPPVPKRNFKKYPVKYIYGTGTERTYARRSHLCIAITIKFLIYRNLRSSVTTVDSTDSRESGRQRRRHPKVPAQNEDRQEKGKQGKRLRIDGRRGQALLATVSKVHRRGSRK